METFETKYGLITLYKNEVFIGESFRKGLYWEEKSLIKLKEFIDPDKNILEIGGHCGTSSIVYASFLNPGKKLHVFEPQYNMYSLLLKNINQNNLQHKIIPYNSGIFCFNGVGKMNNVDIDGGGGIVQKRYNEEQDLGCNFGGIGLGKDGEEINLVTMDNIDLKDIGFIHCDAQGAENFIFSKGIETIKKYRPLILYENNYVYAKHFYDNVCNSYPMYKEEAKFDVKKFCMEELGYEFYFDRFDGGIDTLLIP
jgi:FkbM family methyltransferase